MKFKRKKLWLYAAVGLVAAIAGPLVYLFSERDHMLSLYKAAFSYSSTLEAELAVEELSFYEGPYATELLLRIAVTPYGYYTAKEMAIRKLVQREGDRISPSLAGLLRPESDLYLRIAVSEALSNRECSSTCAYFILRYLEDVWRGVPHREDAYKTTPESARDIEVEQGKVITGLFSVLRREPEITLDLLEGIYGLDGPSPRAFALYVIERIRLLEACPALTTSAIQVRDNRLEGKIQELIRRLDCP